ncbi:MAG: phosphopantothenate/pantothenate synthetase [Spirochaetales bacterium]|nr:phosphopantothenate/pantothenate synthetase [Spirochaetales bacterium]
MNIEIPASHPRAASLHVRESLIDGCKAHVVAYAGLIAHGRGEAFDYLIGEKTIPSAAEAIKAAAAALLTAEHPVISVNGNTAILTPKEIIELSEVSGALIEVNLFYRSKEREKAIQKVLKKAGATRILGIGAAASARIPELLSERRRVDPEGILIADVVLVPLEDGDRTEALVKMGKRVITIDLNPLSRTAQYSSISIIDNVVRAMHQLIREVKNMKKSTQQEIGKHLLAYDNKKILSQAIAHIAERMNFLAAEGCT